MNTRILLLVSLFCMFAAPAIAASDNYLGGDIVLGGGGSNTLVITEIPTAVTPATQVQVPPPVQQDTGSLSVTSSPSGATIFVDGVQRGISPATIPGLSAGTHRMLLKLDGYQDFSAPVTIMGGRTSSYTAPLTPQAPVNMPPSQPAATKAPGFGAFPGLAALGAIVAVKKISR